MRGIIFFREISLITLVLLDTERLNSAGIGEGHISRGYQGQPNFGGSLLFMHTPFDAELPNLTW